MSNINVEGKGPKGPNLEESLAFASTPAAPSRGLAVISGSDEYHAALASVAGQPCIGLISEDVIAGLPQKVVEFGQAVAQIGASIALDQLLAVNANGQLVPAQPGQTVVAIAMEPQTYVSPGSYACVFVLGRAGFKAPGEAPVYLTASGALPVASGTYVLNGAGALAMTLASPTLAQDGTTIYVVALTSHAHTVAAAADAIYGTKTTVTYAAKGDFIKLTAVDLGWMVEGIGGPTPAALS